MANRYNDKTRLKIREAIASLHKEGLSRPEILTALKQRGIKNANGATMTLATVNNQIHQMGLAKRTKKRATRTDSEAKLIVNNEDSFKMALVDLVANSKLRANEKLYAIRKVVA